MKRTSVCALLVLAAILSGCGQTVWMNKDFDSVRPTIDTVAFILPRIDYVELVGRQMRPESDSAAVVSHRVAAVMTQLIGMVEFIPRSAVLVMAQVDDSLRITHDDGMKCALTPELHSVLRTACAKYFICVQGKAFTTPEKLKQDDLLQIDSFRTFFDQPLTYEYQWSGLKLEIALVSATGDVLWYNHNLARDSKYDPSDREQIRSLCLKLLSAR